MEYGLIGGKLGHSYSRLIHELVGGYSYELHALPTESEAHSFLRERAFKAINVTIPYKRLVIEYCDEVEPRAAAIGAVNTVVNKRGKLYGFNTDYPGFAYLLHRHNIQLVGKTVLILGTGGTHDTVAAVCRGEKAGKILTASRTARPGDENTLRYEQAARREDVQIIVNTTPAGMYPDNGTCLLPLDGLPGLEAVLDVVYNPFATELLLRAKDRGIPAYCGFEMLVAQAVYAAEHFLEKKYDEAVIDEVHHTLKRGISNVSLIGMPGCGKTMIGRALAQRLEKTYIDLDTEIESRLGCGIPDVFATRGEEAFRKIEREVLAEVAKENDRVIACGGGVIKTPGNARLLHQNGPVLWVRRPVEALAMGGRPLSTGRQTLREMETERAPLYEACADAAIENDARLENAVEGAANAFEACFDYPQ